MKKDLILLNDKILETELSPEDRKKHELIKKILNEKNCFFKISIEQAYGILRDLGIEEKLLKAIYIQLLDEE